MKTHGWDTKEILVQAREVYGNKLIYPICRKAKLFANIANAKTLADHKIQKIKELGYEVIEMGTMKLL